MFDKDIIDKDEYNYIDEDYKYQWQESEKIDLSTSVEKKKINEDTILKMCQSELRSFFISTSDRSRKDSRQWCSGGGAN